MKKEKQIVVRVTEKMYSEIERCSKAVGLKPSEYVRKVLGTFLKV